ncbi:hypothetical protein [Nocardiopsis sp. NRRL B-16309]|uniref:hypothetical protein n=1 Tax=Nocardiopsis sp. NRRL B-16309 TaxID=1519494 RepID=UPI0012E1D7E1|nr:hypothetical protein [Nocardiopsis sp. NRRL B-16309]
MGVRRGADASYACWPVIPRGGVVISAEDPHLLYTHMRQVEREQREHGYLRWRYGRR